MSKDENGILVAKGLNHFHDVVTLVQAAAHRAYGIGMYGDHPEGSNGADIIYSSFLDIAVGLGTMSKLLEHRYVYNTESDTIVYLKGVLMVQKAVNELVAAFDDSKDDH